MSQEALMAEIGYLKGEVDRLRRIVDLLLPALADMTEAELEQLEESIE